MNKTTKNSVIPKTKLLKFMNDTSLDRKGFH